MRRSSFRWLLPCALLATVAPIAGNARSQETASQAVAVMDADAIIAKNLAAKGGVDVLRTTETVRMTGRVTSPKGQLQMTVSAKRPDRKRTEAEREGQKLIEAFDGTNGWVKLGELPPQAVPPGPQLENAKRQAEFDTGLLNYKEQGRTVELVSKQPVDGSWHLKITPKQGPVSHYHIDAETWLEKKTTTVVPGMGGQSTLETRFSDYRKVDGRVVPFVVEMFVDGRPVSKTELEKIEFNVPIDDAFFRIPPRTPAGGDSHLIP